MQDIKASLARMESKMDFLIEELNVKVNSKESTRVAHLSVRVALGLVDEHSLGMIHLLFPPIIDASECISSSELTLEAFKTLWRFQSQKSVSYVFLLFPLWLP